MKAQRFLPFVLVVLAVLAGAFYLYQARLIVSGTIVDAINGEPLVGVQVSAGESSARSDSQGRYVLTSVPRGSTIAAALDGYQPAKIAAASGWLHRDLTIGLVLAPVVLDGRVTDETTGEPLAGATVTVGDQQATTSGDGSFRFLRVPGNAHIVVSLDGYDSRRMAFSGEPSLPVALQQNTVMAAIVDDNDGRLVGQATLAVDSHSFLPAEPGRFVLRGVKQQTLMAAQADGYLPHTALYDGGSALTITLAANTVSGLVRDQASGRPVAGITITLRQVDNTRTTLSSDSGSFQFRRVRSGAVLTTSGPEHAPAVITYTGQESLVFPLRPDTLRGRVHDLYADRPMAGVAMTLQEGAVSRTALSDDTGAFEFAHVSEGALLSAAATGHETRTITYTGQISVALSLRPNTLRGVIRDSKSGQPIAGAEVSVGSVSGKTSASGEYTLAGIPAGLPLIVTAAGFDRTPVNIGSLTMLDVRLQSGSVRAIFIPFYLLTAPNRVRTLINFAEQAGMNAIVVDIKGDDGYIAYKSTLPLAQEVKAQWPGDMMGLDEVLRLAKQRGLYSIARMVVFKDNLLAEARPDLAVKDKRTNQVWDDCGNGSTYWADPFRKEVVDYNAGIAEEAARMGFDEIQFDYIRFPPACISRVRLENASYAMTSTAETRLAAIENFLSEARKRLKPLGVAIAVDTFGWTLLRDDDMVIGQRMENMAKYVDYICPMVYPSTWEPGALGLDYVPAHPYEIVYESIKFSLNRLKATPGVKIRPWLQDFDDYQSRALPYGVKELDEQRRGAADAGAVGWMLWNAGGSYTEEPALRP